MEELNYILYMRATERTLREPRVSCEYLFHFMKALSYIYHYFLVVSVGVCAHCLEED